MKLIKFTLKAVVFSALPTFAAANFRDGNDLYEDCQQHPQSALDFVIGVTDTVSDLNSFGDRKVFGICLPENVTSGQLRDIACQHLETEPGSRHYTAPTQVIAALLNEFPCPRSP